MKPSTRKTTTKRAPAKPRTPRTPVVPANAAAKEPRDNPGTGQDGTAPERAPEAEVGQASTAVVDQAAPQEQTQTNQQEGDDFDPNLDGGEDADEIFGDNDHGGDQEPDKDPAKANEEKPEADPAKAAATPPAPPPADPEPDKSPAGVEKVVLGSVEGVQRKVNIEVVQAVVGKASTNHAAAMRNAVVSDLMKRMRETDGRCAPMIFTVTDPNDPDPTEAPKLFAGLETLAAAMALEEDHVFVVIIASADAVRAQAAVASRMHRAKSSDDDELMWRVRD